MIGRYYAGSMVESWEAGRRLGLLGEELRGCQDDRYLRTGEPGGEFCGWHSRVFGQTGENDSPDARVGAGAGDPIAVMTCGKRFEDWNTLPGQILALNPGCHLPMPMTAASWRAPNGSAQREIIIRRSPG